MGKIVMTVVIKFAEYSVRAFLLIYALIGLVGIMWFSNSIKISLFIQGVVFVSTASFVGIASFRNFVTRQKKVMYYLVCLIGALVSGYYGMKYVFDGSISQKTFIEQIILVCCFCFMAMRIGSMGSDSDDSPQKVL